MPKTFGGKDQHKYIDTMITFWGSYLRFLKRVALFLGRRWPYLFLLGVVAAVLFALIGPRDYAVLWMIYAAFLASVAAFHVFCYGAWGSRYRILMFCVLVSLSQWGGFAYLLSGLPIAAYVYVSLWFVAAALGFLWPLWDASELYSSRPYSHLFVLFLVVLTAGIGSIYVPMRASSNDIVLRAAAPEVRRRLESVAARSGTEAACLAYQDEHLFLPAPRTESSCSRTLDELLAPYLRQNERCLHRTIAFWIDQFLNNVWGLRQIANCWISEYEIREEWRLNRVVWLLYSALLNLLWVGFALAVLRRLSAVLRRLIPSQDRSRM